jgi:predicted phage terminase large subunit-like protein
MSSPLLDALSLGADALGSTSDILTPEQIDAGRDDLLMAVQNVKSDYIVNWHHRQLADALDKVQRGEITRLIVMMPPQHGKSELVSRHFPAACLGRNPNEKIVACSYAASLASDMGVDVQNIMGSEEYHAMYSTRLKSGVPAASLRGKAKETNLKFDMVGANGYYIGAGVDGPITGRGFTLGIIDDYCKSRKEAESKVWRDKVWKWYTGAFRTRRAGGMAESGSDRIVICATPWHEDDLIGRVLKNAKRVGEVWHILRFPAIADGESAGDYEATTGDDPRDDGLPLWSRKMSVRDLEIERKTSPSDWSSLWQCRPSAAKGNIFGRDHWGSYTVLPKGQMTYTFSLDCAFKDGDSSSFVVLQLWANQGPNHYLVDQWRDRLDYKKTKKLCRDKFREHPEANTKLIEAKANGPAIISELREEFAGLIPVEPKGSKAARAMAIQGITEAGNVYLPEHANWRETFVNEAAAFPWAPNDDQVDAMTQYLERHGTKGGMAFLDKLVGAV